MMLCYTKVMAKVDPHPQQIVEESDRKAGIIDALVAQMADGKRMHPGWFLESASGDYYASCLPHGFFWTDLTDRIEHDTSLPSSVFWPITRFPVKECILITAALPFSTVIAITPPEPVPFFSIGRYGLHAPFAHEQEKAPENHADSRESSIAVPFNSIPNWLYSVFGYYWRDERHTWRIYPAPFGIECLHQARTVPFSL
jgi:hypothetical protein